MISILVPSQFIEFGDKVPFKVICWDSSSKPESVKNSEWLVKDKIYEVKELGTARDGYGRAILGFKLTELTIVSYPYDCFSAMRFLPITTEKQYFEALQNQPD